MRNYIRLQSLLLGCQHRGQLRSYYPGEGGNGNEYPNNNEPDPISPTPQTSPVYRTGTTIRMGSYRCPTPCPWVAQLGATRWETQWNALGRPLPLLLARVLREQFHVPTGLQPLAEQASCIPADPGNFVTGEASTEQTPCSPGTYQPASLSTIHYRKLWTLRSLSGATNRDPCWLGHGRLPGQTSCFTASSDTSSNPRDQTPKTNANRAVSA